MSRKPDAPEGLSYRGAGVDIDAMNEALGAVKDLARETATPAVLSEIGGFGGLFQVSGWREPVLVASVDGVGTKLAVAQEMACHATIGADLVNHCINDILVQGAVPLFFMDYFASGRLQPQVVVEVVRGMASACREAECALLGGETAEMPGFYREGQYDIAGFILGAVEKRNILDGCAIQSGDRLLGLESTGLHTNGYSLARKVIFQVRGLRVSDPMPGMNLSVGEALLAPHRSYLKAIRPLLSQGKVKGLAHITGGGLTDNLPRILPPGCGAEIHRGTWPVPPLFERIREWGGLSAAEMERTFNLGVGLVLVVSPDDAAGVIRRLQDSGETVHPIGSVVEGTRKVTYRPESG